MDVRNRLASLVRRHPYAAAGAAVFLLVAAGLWQYGGFLRHSLALVPCNFLEGRSLKVECAFAKIEDELAARGTGEAMKMFAAATRVVGPFKGHCHDLAHRVGDAAYFSMYEGETAVLTEKHPYEMTICNFGFFHGYYEHLFQEHATPEDVMNFCAPLPEGPEFYHKMIRQICVHGGGHGFVFAELDKHPLNGDIYTFGKHPLELCAQVTGFTDDELSRCPAGVFTQLTQFQLYEESGFAFSSSSDEWFPVCERFGRKYAPICIKSTAQLLFDKFGPEATVAACPALATPEGRMSCVWGVVWGYFSGKAGEKEFSGALDFCASDAVKDMGYESECHVALAGEIISYFPQSQKAGFCGRFPEQYREECLRRIGENLK